MGLELDLELELEFELELDPKLELQLELELEFELDLDFGIGSIVSSRREFSPGDEYGFEMDVLTLASAIQALADAYFKGLAKVEREPSAQPITKMEFEFERRRINKDDVRELIYREVTAHL